MRFEKGTHIWGLCADCTEASTKPQILVIFQNAFLARLLKRCGGLIKLQEEVDRSSVIKSIYAKIYVYAKNFIRRLSCSLSSVILVQFSLDMRRSLKSWNESPKTCFLNVKRRSSTSRSSMFLQPESSPAASKVCVTASSKFIAYPSVTVLTLND